MILKFLFDISSSGFLFAFPNISFLILLLLLMRNNNTFNPTQLKFQLLIKIQLNAGTVQCDQKKSPNVYKSCPNTISLEKWLILTPLHKFPKNVGDLGKLIVAKDLKSCPKCKKSPFWSHWYRTYFTSPNPSKCFKY